MSTIDRISAPDALALLKPRLAIEDTGDDFARHLEAQGREAQPPREPPSPPPRREIAERRQLREARNQDRAPDRPEAAADTPRAEDAAPRPHDETRTQARTEIRPDGDDGDRRASGDGADAAPPPASEPGADTPRPAVVVATASTPQPPPAAVPAPVAAETQAAADTGSQTGVPDRPAAAAPGQTRDAAPQAMAGGGQEIAPQPGAMGMAEGDGDAGRQSNSREAGRAQLPVPAIQPTLPQTSERAPNAAIAPVDPAIGGAGQNPASRPEPASVAAVRRPEGAASQAQAPKPVASFAETLGLQFAADGTRMQANGQIAQTAAPNQPGQTFVREGVSIERVPFEVVQAAKSGVREIGIRLDPPELGRIDVTLDIDDAGKVTTRLVVERSETLDQLRRDAPSLERVLNDAGLKTDQNSLQFSLRGEGRQQHQDDGQRGRGRRGVIAIDAAEINSWRSPPPETTAARLRGGVDLRI